MPGCTRRAPPLRPRAVPTAAKRLGARAQPRPALAVQVFENLTARFSDVPPGVVAAAVRSARGETYIAVRKLREYVPPASAALETTPSSSSAPPSAARSTPGSGSGGAASGGAASGGAASGGATREGPAAMSAAEIETKLEAARLARAESRARREARRGGAGPKPGRRGNGAELV